MKKGRLSGLGGSVLILLLSLPSLGCKRESTVAGGFSPVPNRREERRCCPDHDDRHAAVTTGGSKVVAITNASGVASVTLTLPGTAQPVQVLAEAPYPLGHPTVTFTGTAQ